jgi:hypothetical protein
MKRRFGGWVRTLATLFLMAFSAIVVAIALAWSALPLDHATILIDGETIQLSGIDGWHAALVIATAGVGVLIALIVGALAVVFGLLAAALAILVALVIVMATLALVASPLLLIVWAIWRIARPAHDPRPAAA